MKNLIKELNNLRPTKKQVKDKPAYYAFGYVDAINAAIELVKNLGICSVIGRFCKDQQVEWDGLRYWVVEDNGGDKVLVANSKTQQHEEYNDWWVKRDELNAL